MVSLSAEHSGYYVSKEPAVFGGGLLAFAMGSPADWGDGSQMSQCTEQGELKVGHTAVAAEWWQVSMWKSCSICCVLLKHTGELLLVLL